MLIDSGSQERSSGGRACQCKPKPRPPELKSSVFIKWLWYLPSSTIVLVLIFDWWHLISFNSFKLASLIVLTSDLRWWIAQLLFPSQTSPLRALLSHRIFPTSWFGYKNCVLFLNFKHLDSRAQWITGTNVAACIASVPFVGNNKNSRGIQFTTELAKGWTLTVLYGCKRWMTRCFEGPPGTNLFFTLGFDAVVFPVHGC